MSAEEFVDALKDSGEPTGREQHAFMAGVNFGRLIEVFHRASSLQLHMTTGLRLPQSAAIHLWLGHAKKLMQVLREMGQSPEDLWAKTSDGITKWSRVSDEHYVCDNAKALMRAWESPHVDTQCQLDPKSGIKHVKGFYKKDK